MESTHFMTPMEAVQTVSMFSYLTILSDFLLGKNLLNVTNQFQPIPVVNGLYHYLNDNSNENQTIIIERKLQLARKLIEGTDLYGAKENEIPDPIFVDSLYRHIITTLVFEKFINIYGFLVEIVRNSKDLEIKTIHDNIMTALTEEKFQNENGNYSMLETSTISEIIKNFIHPLFPKILSENINLLSIDYIYAQAGLMFLLSGISSPLLKSTEFNQSGEINSTVQFAQYVIIAHTIEKLVIDKEMDEVVLGIFSLPALFYYTYNEKEMLKNISIENIMNNATLGIEAFKMLFKYLNEKFEKLDSIKKNDYRYQFYLARGNFKNRTTLAREIISSKCPLVKKEELEDEVTKYKNNPDDYQCNTGNGKKLEDVNRLYQEQVNDITNKYFVYEKETIKEAMGSEFIEAIDDTNVEITRGLVTYQASPIGYNEFQWVKESDDLFRFHFVDDKEASYYFAFVRENNEIMVMVEDYESSDCSLSKKRKTKIIHCNPGILRDKLELSRDEEFSRNHFPLVKKHKDERFEVFLNRIAEERANKFKAIITREGYDQTRKEWWKDFGLSLIPFYTCVHGIKTGNTEEETSCLYDSLAFLPVVGDLEFVLEKFTTVTTRALFKAAGTNFASLTLKTTWKTTLAEISEILSEEGITFSESLTKETFQNFGLSLIRSIDPGFELIYDIGREGLSSMRNLISKLGKLPSSFETLNSLFKYEKTISNTFTKVENKFSNMDVYANSLSKENSAYGHKYIKFSKNRIFPIRQIEEYGNMEKPVVMINGKENLCNAVDINTGEIIEKEVLHIKSEHFRNEKFEFKIESFHNTEVCDSVRLRRAPTTCIRSYLRKNRREVEKEALDFSLNYDEFILVDVRAKLRKFIFPGNGEKQLEFVRDWRELLKEGKKNLPAWSKEYEIDDPDLFEHLMYSNKIDERVTSADEAMSRIESIMFKNFKISSVENIIEQYNLYRIYEMQTFEDFVALTYLKHFGFTEFGINNIEGRTMQRALYRLAIRQMEIPKLPHVLYRGETRPRDVVNKLLYPSNKELEFNRITFTSTNRDIALQYHKNNKNVVNILYKITVFDQYPEVILNSIGLSDEEKTVFLLPGSKFVIDTVSDYIINEKEVLLVKLSIPRDVQKHTFYKNIMNELEKLKEKDVNFMKKVWSSFCCSLG
ncbi:uncharacterized protein LOC127277487 [Leptopilina boulardi]|uniref:uncharacterized protein LOC127277487 n=1 Tax=Leptopilina boulardi TaxID=63433 RepID=UPI0021F68DEA|nr:uncharacterized protein LOC127277487 [Leptopilina boulardi]